MNTKNNKQVEYKNVSKFPLEKEDLKLDATILKESIKTPYPKENKRALRIHNVLKFIKENPGTTSYETSKKLEYSYSDVCRIVKDLEYCNILIIKIEYFDSVVKKRLFIPEVKNE